MTRITSDSWLADLMGRAVFRVDADTPGTAEEVLAHAREQRDAFYFAKVPTDRVAIVRALECVGFGVVDVNVTFAMKPPAILPPPIVDVGECTPRAADAVLNVAGTCFKYTRFHLDPLVDDAVAHRIKREWVRNYVLGKRGDRLFVAYLAGEPAGFLAALVGERAGVRTAVIDLVGVNTTLQKRGVGESLVRAFVQHYRSSCASLIVGTQVANAPSVRLYEKIGFSLAGSEYVLHKHIPVA